MLTTCFEIKEGTEDKPNATSGLKKRPWSAQKLVKLPVEE